MPNGATQSVDVRVGSMTVLEKEAQEHERDLVTKTREYERVFQEKVKEKLQLRDEREREVRKANRIKRRKNFSLKAHATERKLREQLELKIKQHDEVKARLEQLRVDYPQYISAAESKISIGRYRLNSSRESKVVFLVCCAS